MAKINKIKELLTVLASYYDAMMFGQCVLYHIWSLPLDGKNSNFYKKNTETILARQ